MAEPLTLVRALRLGTDSRIAFVGAGGKTSTIFRLAREYGSRIIVTATTHLAESQIQLADTHYIIQDRDRDALEVIADPLPEGITLITGPIDETRRTKGIVGSALDGVESIAKRYSVPVLIEADGARGKLLKAPDAHEPAFPGMAKTGVVLASLGALGKPLTEELVHRSGLFADLSGLPSGEAITLEALASVMLHEQGGLKNLRSDTCPVALLNQVTTPELASQAQRLAEMLLPRYHAVISADIPHYSEPGQEVIHAVHEPIAAVILAAGGSQRFGSPKQLLDWHGQPFVRHIAQTALVAGMHPVIVVTGAHAAQVASALAGLPVGIVENRSWEAGQSTSVKTGVAALPASTGGVMFLLSDQPQIPAALLRALAAEHAATLAPIIAPQIDGQRGNPVLFDRAVFSEFAQLSGDAGGRSLFSRFKVEWIPWLDGSILGDVDSPEDYHRLLQS